MSSSLSTASLWLDLRSDNSSNGAEKAIWDTIPDGVEIGSIEHLRTAHYAVYRVYATSGESWIARVGVIAPEDNAPADNTGYLGTSVTSPSGQTREYEIASGYASANADVCVPKHYAHTLDGFDTLWMPFVNSIENPLSAAQWHRAITGLQRYQPQSEVPVFTNRAKTFARLDESNSEAGERLREQYDSQLEVLFKTATKWSLVHGDAHAGNALNTGDSAILFDFDTACWAPSVWDITHLLNRAGTNGNTGYTAAELRSLFSFTDAEVEAALLLRRTAALVAKEHRESVDKIK